MDKSESIINLSKAMLKVQGVIGKAPKTSKNPFFKSKYADLTTIWDACRDVLQENNMVILQPTFAKEGDIYLTTLLIHAQSGEWISGELLLKLDKQTPQGVGSAITYARRYALAAIIGVCTEDDDGEKATDRKESVAISLVTPEEVKGFQASIREISKKGISTQKINSVLSHYEVNVGTLDQLVNTQVEELTKALISLKSGGHKDA